MLICSCSGVFDVLLQAGIQYLHRKARKQVSWSGRRRRDVDDDLLVEPSDAQTVIQKQDNNTIVKDIHIIPVVDEQKKDLLKLKLKWRRTDDDKNKHLEDVTTQDQDDVEYKNVQDLNDVLMEEDEKNESSSNNKALHTKHSSNVLISAILRKVQVLSTVSTPSNHPYIQSTVTSKTTRKRSKRKSRGFGNGMSRGKMTAKRIREQKLTYHKEKSGKVKETFKSSNTGKDCEKRSNNKDVMTIKKRKRTYSNQVTAVTRRWKRAEKRATKYKEKSQLYQHENKKLQQIINWLKKHNERLCNSQTKLQERLDNAYTQKRKYQLQKADIKRKKQKLKTSLEQSKEHVDDLLKKQ